MRAAISTSETVSDNEEPVQEPETPPPPPPPVVGRHRTFEPSEVPLTDADVRHLYGDLVDDAMGQFLADPSYVVDMASSASLVAYRREEARIRAQLIEEGTPLTEVAAKLAERLAARGLSRPKAQTPRVRRRT